MLTGALLPSPAVPRREEITQEALRAVSVLRRREDMRHPCPPQTARIRRLAFVPPNPKEFDRATGSFFSRAVFGV